MEKAELIQWKAYLFSLAYQLLGEIQEAEDMVQDTFEKWLKMDTSQVSQPKSYLTRILLNRSIDRLKELQQKRKLYKGTWLPEPLLAEQKTEESAGEIPSVDYTVLVLLEKLNPYERAVFILRECFDQDYEEIAGAIGQSKENCRQLLHRANEKLQQKEGKKQAIDRQQQQNFLAAFLKACQEQNLEELEKLLKADIAMYSDGGGKVPAAMKPLFGKQKVIRFLLGVMKLSEDVVFSFQPRYINGLPGGIVYNETLGRIETILVMQADETGIKGLFYIRNPEKMHL